MIVFDKCQEDDGKGEKVKVKEDINKNNRTRYSSSSSSSSRCQRYDVYKQNIQFLYQHLPHIQLIEFPNTAPLGKLVRVLYHILVTKRSSGAIQTNRVVIIQDDMPFVSSDINFDSIVQDMKFHTNLSYVSFNLPDRGIANMTFDKSLNKYATNAFGTELISNSTGNTYITTSVWTDNNYICSTQYLSTIIQKSYSTFFPEWYMMSQMKTYEK